jgi:glycosyltransferase involved in cell wall biosynthesis
MRILHVCPFFVPAYGFGGLVKSVHELCRTLVRKGHEVTVITTDCDLEGRLGVPKDRFVTVDGIEVKYAPILLRRGFVSPAQVRCVRREVGRFDLVHIQGIYYWGTVAAARLAVSSGRPYVISPRGMLLRNAIAMKGSFRKHLFIELMVRRVLKNAAAIHYTAEGERLHSQDLGFRSRTVVVPNGIEPAEYLPPRGENPLLARFPHLAGKRIVLYLGRLDPKKGLRLLVDAHARLVASGRRVHLLIAGPDSRKYAEVIRARVAECGLKGHVDFAGLLTGDEKLCALHMADVFVLPSYSENFGMAVLEALCCGKPVVVTEEVDLAPYILKYQAGMVTACEAEGIADAIAHLLDHPEKSSSMGRNGRQLVEERFTWDTVADEMLDVYRAVLEGKVEEGPRNNGRGTL